MLNVEDLSARLGALNGDSAILGGDALSAISELSGKVAGLEERFSGVESEIAQIADDGE